MNRTLQNLVQKELCPDGIWQLTDVMPSQHNFTISRNCIFEIRICLRKYSRFRESLCKGL